MAHLTDVEAVDNYLGGGLDDAQRTAAQACLSAADAAIQAYCDRQWLSGPITDDLYEPNGPLLYLRQRPVASVERVTAGWYFAAPPVTLTAGSDYLVRDLARGVLLLTPWRTGRPSDRPYETLNVSYTPVATVPADVSLAATMLVAWLLGPSRDGDLNAPSTPVVRERVGDVDVQYAAPPSAVPGTVAWPPAVLALLAPYRATLVFA